MRELTDPAKQKHQQKVTTVGSQVGGVGGGANGTGELHSQISHSVDTLPMDAADLATQRVSYFE